MVTGHTPFPATLENFFQFQGCPIVKENLQCTNTDSGNFVLHFKHKLSIMLSIFLKPVFLLSMPGESEWLLILLVILLFFGGKKIPDLMRGIGKGVREFNDAKEHVKNEIEAGMREKDSEKKELINNTPVPADIPSAVVSTSVSQNS